jgi:hypothetical protein
VTNEMDQTVLVFLTDVMLGNILDVKTSQRLDAALTLFHYHQRNLSNRSASVESETHQRGLRSIRQVASEIASDTTADMPDRIRASGMVIL